MEGTRKRAEAQRWLEISERLLMARDLVGSKKFAVRAQESDPVLDGVDQILAVADVLLSAEKRINNHMDWYAILQIDHRSDDIELIKRQYRKFALLLHPDKNKSVFADNAFKLVSDAWTVLSDPSKKSLYDNELNLFLKFDPVSLHNPQSTPPPPPSSHPPPQQQRPANQETPVRRSSREKRKPGKGTNEQQQQQQQQAVLISQPRNENRTETRVPTRSTTRTAAKMSSFWTACPYCYNLYEYPRVYEECCLKCQNCRRAFHAAIIPTPPPIVPGQDAYYCCWAFFPLGFQVPSLVAGQKTGLPNWTPFSAMNPATSQPGSIQNPFAGSKINSDKDGGDDDNGDGSDGSWDHTETGSRKKGKSVEVVRKTPVIKKTARKSVAPRSTRVTVTEPLLEGHVIQGNVLPKNVNTPRKDTKKTLAKKQTRHSGKFATESEIVDLNADVNGDFDDPNCTLGEGVHEAGGTDDPIAGIGFFEGLDEILGNLGNFPILSVPGDQNKATGNA